MERYAIMGTEQVAGRLRVSVMDFVAGAMYTVWVPDPDEEQYPEELLQFLKLKFPREN